TFVGDVLADFFFQAEDGIRDFHVTGVQTCALPILHQPLLMHGLHFSSANERLVLLTADLGWWKNAEDEDKIRKKLLRYFDLAESELIFALSHTHAGPSISSADVELPGGKLIPPYLDSIAKHAIQC